MNILLVAIDTLRADHLGCYGYDKPTSPNLDQFARQGASSERLFCPGVPTQPNFTTTFTGQYSITTGIVTHGGTAQLSPDAPYLTEELQDAGLHTGAADNLAAMQPWFGRGWDDYMNPARDLKYIQWSDWHMYNQVAIPWLREHAREPFFLFVHYWDPHTPYLPPKDMWYDFYDGDPCDPDKDTLTPLFKGYWGQKWQERWFSRLPQGLTDAEFIVGLYDAEIKHVDRGFGELMNALEDVGVADDTLVMVFSDHGEMMYRHDIFFDHHGLYDGNLHVPLLVRWPGHIEAETRVHQLLQHVDLAPTLLEAVGAGIPEAMEGESFLDLLTAGGDRVLHDWLVTQECTWQAKWAIRTDDWKFIKARERDMHGMPMQELYDLHRDPDELSNLAQHRSDVAGELEHRLKSWIVGMMSKHGIEQDPLVAQGITLGKRWGEWVDKKGYW